MTNLPEKLTWRIKLPKDQRSVVEGPIETIEEYRLRLEAWFKEFDKKIESASSDNENT